MRRYRALGYASVAAALLVTAIPRDADAQAKSSSPRPSGTATKAPAPREGTVLALDNGDLVLDLGNAKGVHEGQVVELWRPLRVKHPVTGEVLADRFRIGALKLTQVQATMSLARVEGEPSRAPAPGDRVVVERIEQSDASEPPTAKPGATTSPVVRLPSSASTASSGAPAPCVITDPEASELSRLFAALGGAAPEARIAAYASYVRAHPKSRFAPVLREEAQQLHAQLRPEEKAYETSSAPIARLRPGVPQRVAFELDSRFVGAVVHVRSKGAKAYRSLPMASVGARYWAATLPGDAIDEGEAQYFVEGVLGTGASVALIGTAADPREVEVEKPPLVGKTSGTLAQLQLQSEYASFNAKSANDYVFQTEGQSGFRLGDIGVRAVRSGFGVLRGKGGPLGVLDAGGAPTDVGLTYGYVEAEFGITPIYGLIARPIIGLRDDGVAGGAQGFLRIGNDLKTNLLLGGEVLGGVGLRGVVQLEWRTIPRVPVVLRSEVTNQPAGFNGDVGVRTIAQVGYEVAHDFVVSARGSFQGRTINHAGPGGGLGVSYQW